jgi:glycosyltransferase involved in cell wall biosynthesis
MTRKKHILFFIFRLYGGGAERMVSNLSLELCNEFDITIVTYDQPGKTYNFGGEHITIDLPYADNPHGNSALQRARRLLVLSRELRRIKKEKNADVVVSFAEQANIINLITGGPGQKMISVRTLLSKELEHSPKVKKLLPVIRRLYNRARTIVVPARMIGIDMEQALQLDNSNIQVLYNFVEPGRIDPLAAEPLADTMTARLFAEHPVLLNVGRISKEKGQWLLLQLMARLREEGSSAKLAIIGTAHSEGNLIDYLLQLARDLNLAVFDGTRGALPDGLQYDVYFLGFQKNPYQFMHRSRAVLLPSVFEGFPNTLLEAMQCGVPVMAADCLSGIKEILAPDAPLGQFTTVLQYGRYGLLAPAVTDTTTYAVPQLTIEEWVKGVQELLCNETLHARYIQLAPECVARFDKQEILQQWKKLFRQQA